MRANFDKALAAVLVHEGGYVNHPKDPGGATNKGITQKVYSDWRFAHDLPSRSVKDITDAEVMAIYKHLYWDAIKGDELPAGVDYAAFDFAVNSGVSRAARYLQEAAGVNVDGQIGPVTLAAIKARPAQDMIAALCDARMGFLKRLSTFDTFGRGWSRRVAEVEVRAKGMA